MKLVDQVIAIFLPQCYYFFLPLQKVFPEAVKAGNRDSTPGLYSGDSEDEDFDPDRPCTHEKVQTDESYSDDENATDSDNSEPQPKEKQHLVLTSDDSEDDNYDPDAPNPCKVKGGSSSSDFSSDSEDLEAVLVDDDLHGSNGAVKSLSPKGQRGPIRISRGRGKNQAINDELKSLLASEPGENGFTPASARRSVERLDYKRLHDVSFLSHCFIFHYHFSCLENFSFQYEQRGAVTCPKSYAKFYCTY